MRLLNDVHIGAIRAAGTTPPSQVALRSHIREQFKFLLPTNQDLVLLGDLFDAYNVPLVDLLETYLILKNWLEQYPQVKLYNMLGNHDASKSSNVLSSFLMLDGLLSAQFGERYIGVKEPMMTPYGYMIPHMRNQDLLELALQSVPQTKYLFVHCNYDNNFAAQSDQSLNISREQVQALPVEYVVFAHEHVQKMAPKVLIPGNQIATSVSDWLNSEHKQYMSFVPSGDTFNHSFQQCAVREDNYVELNWKELRVTDHAFVRVVGDATAEESAAVVNSIAKLRKASNAFVVANAVKIEAETEAVDFEQVLANVNQFSVQSELKALFTPEEWAVLEPLCSPA